MSIEFEKTSGKNKSYWIESVEPLVFEELNKNIQTDVVIVGGGISGITTAYLLSKNKKHVIVVEDGNIGSGETGRTTAHIASALDDRYFNLEKYFSEEGAKLVADSHSAAVNFIEGAVKDEDIDCDFMRLDGYLFLHPTDNFDSLKKELEATNRAGLTTQLVDSTPGISTEAGPSLKFLDQAVFHPLKYLKGLSRAIIANGGRIFTNTHASDFDPKGISTSKGFRIDADHIVIATNTPVNDKLVIHTKQAPYRTYAIGALVPVNSLPFCLWWDTGDHQSEWTNYPYHYVRLQKYDNRFDLLISGGEDHKTGQSQEESIDEEQRFKILETWTRKYFPMINEVKYKWSGQVMEPVDSLGFIGRNPVDKDNVYLITGDSGNGITHGTIGGMLITAMILEKKNRWEELYSPSRITLKTSPDFLKEQANVAKQYFKYFSDGEVSSFEEIQSGEGAIIRSGTNKYAVYKDNNGQIYSYFAVCPHMKCILEWNNSEKSFDCPCHGSRFDPFGKVINGPANVDLKQVEIGIKNQ